MAFAADVSNKYVTEKIKKKKSQTVSRVAVMCIFNAY